MSDNSESSTNLHTVAFNDVGGHGHILRKVTLAEAQGRIGSHWPCLLDGVEGHFSYPAALSVFVKFDHGEGITTDPPAMLRVCEPNRTEEPIGGKQVFNTLRAANIARLPQFKNRKGQPAHSEPDGSDWSPAQWLQAVVGELGEYANLRKNHERGDIDADTFYREAADELADVATYLDILAFRLGIDLEAAIASKFNRVSERVGSDVRLAAKATGKDGGQQ